MMKTLIAAAAALALMTPLCVHAATPADRAPAAAAAPAANPEAEALVRRYLAAVHFERTMDSMQAAMLPVIAAQTARSNNLTADDQKMVVDIVRQVMRDKMMPKMIIRLLAGITMARSMRTAACVREATTFTSSLLCAMLRTSWRANIPPTVMATAMMCRYFTIRYPVMLHLVMESDVKRCPSR